MTTTTKSAKKSGGRISSAAYHSVTLRRPAVLLTKRQKPPTRRGPDRSDPFWDAFGSSFGVGHASLARGRTDQRERERAPSSLRLCIRRNQQGRPEACASKQAREAATHARIGAPTNSAPLLAFALASPFLETCGGRSRAAGIYGTRARAAGPPPRQSDESSNDLSASSFTESSHLPTSRPNAFRDGPGPLRFGRWRTMKAAVRGSKRNEIGSARSSRRRQGNRSRWAEQPDERDERDYNEDGPRGEE
jgi:hypothetical protein